MRARLYNKRFKIRLFCPLVPTGSNKFSNGRHHTARLYVTFDTLELGIFVVGFAPASTFSALLSSLFNQILVTKINHKGNSSFWHYNRTLIACLNVLTWVLSSLDTKGKGMCFSITLLRHIIKIHLKLCSLKQTLSERRT